MVETVSQQCLSEMRYCNLSSGSQQAQCCLSHQPRAFHAAPYLQGGQEAHHDQVLCHLGQGQVFFTVL